MPRTYPLILCYDDILLFSQVLNSFDFFSKENEVAFKIINMSQDINLTKEKIRHKKMVNSILITIRKKFIVNNFQKKYTKNLKYFEAVAIIHFCEIILKDEFLSPYTIAIFSQLHQQLDTQIV